MSDSSRAGCLASSMARRISATGSTMPVAVSLWTVSTALISCALSLARRSASLVMSAPLRQSAAKVSTLMPRLTAISAQLWREIAGLDDQHGVAGGEQVGQRGFPGAVAARVVHIECLVGLQDPLHAGMAGVLDGQELVRHEIEDGPVHRPQHAVGNVGRAGIVEELASAGLGIHVLGSGLRKVPELRGAPLAKQARLAMVGH